MLAPLLLAATLIIGPERALPAEINEPVAVDQFGPRFVDVAAAGRDFVIVWYAHQAIWSQWIDGGSGKPASATASRVAFVPEQTPAPEPRVASNGETAVVVWNQPPVY